MVSMDQKRHRRPNVRLEEIGEFPAAFACGFSPRSRINPVHKRFEHEIGGFSGVEIDDDNPKQEQGEINSVVSMKISNAVVHNRENKDPITSKLPLDVPGLNETGMAKSEVDFGTVTRKCRVMRRRGRSANGNNRIFAFALGLGHGPGSDNDFNEFNDFLHPEDSPASREDTENKRHSSQAYGELNNNGSWDEHATSEGGHDIADVDGDTDTVAVGGHGDRVHGVRGWLEDQGFGNYVDVFELHEVDEETLPLLTFGDLKEMGIVAVGPRRKLYNAIRHLRDGS